MAPKTSAPVIGDCLRLRELAVGIVAGYAAKSAMASTKTLAQAHLGIVSKQGEFPVRLERDWKGEDCDRVYQRSSGMTNAIFSV
jgi:hypothetical protein